MKKKLFIAGGIVVITFIMLIVCNFSYLRLRISTPNQFFIKTENHFEIQSGNACSGYAAAYVFRHLGVDAKGEEIYQDIPGKNTDGTVTPERLTWYLNKKGYKADLCYGSLLQLKNAVSKGIPVIVFVRVSGDSSDYHYLSVTGYDDEYIYVAESLGYMVNNKENYYNRKIKTEEFKKMWKTDIRRKNLFIIISK